MRIELHPSVDVRAPLIALQRGNSSAVIRMLRAIIIAGVTLVIASDVGAQVCDTLGHVRGGSCAPGERDATGCCLRTGGRPGRGAVGSARRRAATPSCPDGLERSRATHGQCCAPGQRWRDGGCSGTRRCPEGWSVAEREGHPGERQCMPQGTRGGPMVPIPAGATWDGTVVESPYLLDRALVTVADYAVCLREGACSPPEAGELCSFGAAGLRHPVSCVTRDQAEDYCHWAGKRLPTDAEWELAARGTEDDRIYPWGDAAPNDRLARWGRSCDRPPCTAPTGSHRAGASPYGVLDMAGNLWEWTDPETVRGGGWGSSRRELDSTEHYFFPRGDRPRRSLTYQTIGFRCARDATPTPQEDVETLSTAEVEGAGSGGPELLDGEAMRDADPSASFESATRPGRPPTAEHASGVSISRPDPGPAVEGVVAHVPGRVLLRVELGRGDHFRATTCRLGARSERDPALELRGPAGQPVTSLARCGQGDVELIAPEEGTYLLHASCQYGGTRCGGTVAYRVTRFSGRHVARPEPGEPREGTVPHVPGTATLQVELARGDFLVAHNLANSIPRGQLGLAVQGPLGERLDHRFVHSNDDYSHGAWVELIAPEDGMYTVLASCAQDEEQQIDSQDHQRGCSGTIVYRAFAAGPVPVRGRTGDEVVRGTLPYAVQQGTGTALRVRMEPGERLIVRTRMGAVLRVHGPGTRIEDRGFPRISQLAMTAPEPGVYDVIAFCGRGTTHCRGRIEYEVHAAVPAPPAVRLVTVARGLVHDASGGALLADALVEVHPIRELSLRLELQPGGVGAGDGGGILGGTLGFTMGLELDMFGVGLGLGASTLANQLGSAAPREAPSVLLRARFGRRSMFHFESQVSFAVVDQVELVSMRHMLRIPTRILDVVLLGLGGNDGVALGEAALVFWVVSEGARPILGVSVHAGGGAVFYQPRCRSEVGCGQIRYGGPSAGIGLEWRS